MLKLLFKILALLVFSAGNALAASTFLQDSFAGTASTPLSEHVGEQAHWSKSPNRPGTLLLDGTGNVTAAADSDSLYVAAELPASLTNFDLQATYTLTGSHSSYPGIGVVNAAGDRLVAMYDSYYQSWDLTVNSSIVAFSGVNSAPLTAGHGYVVKFSARPGGVYTITVDGVMVVQATISTFAASNAALSGYGQAGIGISSLIGTDPAGAGNNAPSVGFTPSAINGTAPLSVTFANTTAGALTYQWDFGDGSTSTTASPSHTFTGAGNYKVVLTATGQGGSASQQQTIVVTTPVTNLGSSAVNFVTDGDSITQGYPGTADQSWPARAQVALGANWTLSNIAVGGQRADQRAASATSNLQPLFQSGKRNVLVFMAGTNDLAQYTAQGYTGEHSPQDVFNAIQSEVSQAQALGYDVYVGTLLDTTKGDGFEASTADRNTLNNLIRAAYGSRVIDWASDPILGNPHGVANNSYYFADYLHPTSAGYQIMANDAVQLLGATTTTAAPTAAFTATPPSGIAPLTVQLTNTSQNASSYAWTFGDGASSTATNESHVFNIAGSYVVSLTATGANGNQSTTQTIITVTSSSTQDGVIFGRDSFAGSSATALDLHVGETAHWTKVQGSSGALVLDGLNHIRGMNNDTAVYALSETPANPSGWDLQGDFVWKKGRYTNYLGLGWMDLATGHRFQLCYNAYYNCWSVTKDDVAVGGSPALGAFRAGQIFSVRISARAGGAMTFLVNETAVATFVDPTVATATKGRMCIFNYGTSGFMLSNLSGVQRAP